MINLKAIGTFFLLCVMAIPVQAESGGESKSEKEDPVKHSESEYKDPKGENGHHSDTISLAEERSNTEVAIGNLRRARNLAICLDGENTRVVRRPKKADCNSLVWFNVRDSVIIGAKILQNALNDTLDAGGEVQAVCKSCTATCQTVAWISGQSSYSDIDVGGGQTPSECIDQAADACGAGYSRFLFSATCKQ